MTSTSWMPQINRYVCIGCGDCIHTCPTQALAQVDGKASLTSPDRCTYCGKCEDLCSVSAIGLPLMIRRLENNQNTEEQNS